MCYLVAHTEQTSKWASMYRHATRPALALRLPCPTRPDVHLCASDHCTLRSNSPYRLIIRTVHCTQMLVYSSMLCVVCCWCCEVCGVPACCLCPDLFVCVPGVRRLPVTGVGLLHFGWQYSDDSGLIVHEVCVHAHAHTHHTTGCDVMR